MKVYYDRATTPLGFHYFINYFWLPLFVIRNLGTLFFSEIQFSYYAIATSLVTVVLAIIAFFGFIDWSSIGWRFFRLLVFAIVLGNLLGMILSIVYSDDYTVVSYYLFI
ncbi:MAG: hypothetical protein IKD93_01030 [Firmicutes bacterium]|nr:hypothetical protein [Bacillota bacterium]